MEVGCDASWTNNACESMNHVLKQRTQWRISHLPDLTDNCRALMEAQYKEADRALLGLGDFSSSQVDCQQMAVDVRPSATACSRGLLPSGAAV